MQANATGGTLNYQLMGASGEVTQNVPSPPGTLAAADFAAYITVGPKQTYTANAQLSVGDGQVVPPGTYTDTLYLGVYQSGGGGQYTRVQIPAAALSVSIGVYTQMKLSIAGGGRRTTLNFGDFVQGAPSQSTG